MFEAMDAAVGRWRLELEAEDGHLKGGFRHEPLSASDLERCDKMTI